MRGQVEICISDNASDDGTQALVARYSRENPDTFVYHRHPTNRGIPGNLMALVNIARGDYCWLLSSDDALEEQALSCVLSALSQHPTLAGITVNLNSYDPTLTRILQEGLPAVLSPQRPDQAQVFTSPEQIFRECGSAQGCLSMQVFDRSLWLETLAEIGEAKFVSFRYFPYLYPFGKMVKKRPEWMWLPERLIKIRTENDALSKELNQNKLKYQVTVMEELHRIWSGLFGPSSATCQSLMRANFCLFWNGFALLIYKSRSACTAADEARALVVWTRCLFLLPVFWVTTLPVLLTPSFVLRAVVPPLKRTGWVPVLRTWKRHLTQRAQGGGVPNAPEPP